MSSFAIERLFQPPIPGAFKCLDLDSSRRLCWLQSPWHCRLRPRRHRSPPSPPTTSCPSRTRCSRIAEVEELERPEGQQIAQTVAVLAHVGLGGLDALAEGVRHLRLQGVNELPVRRHERQFEALERQLVAGNDRAAPVGGEADVLWCLSGASEPRRRDSRRANGCGCRRRYGRDAGIRRVSHGSDSCLPDRQTTRDAMSFSRPRSGCPS